MKTIITLLLALLLCSCGSKEMVFYEIQDLGSEVSFIGITSGKSDPDDVFYFIQSGEFKDTIDVDFISKNDYEDARLWHVSFYSLECGLNDPALKDSFNVNIRVHDFSESIPTIEDVNKIPVRWFGFWGDSYEADRLFIDRKYVKIRSLFDCS